jgi:hypothetical protein
VIFDFCLRLWAVSGDCGGAESMAGALGLSFSIVPEFGVIGRKLDFDGWIESTKALLVKMVDELAELMEQVGPVGFGCFFAEFACSFEDGFFG